MKMKMNEDYKVLDIHQSYIEKDDIATIEILTGDFKDTQFTFGTVKVNEDEDNEIATLSFDYTVHNNDKLQKNEDFELVLEKIMNNILIESLEQAEREYERRKKDTETPD
jgi:hypothetical protein